MIEAIRNGQPKLANPDDPRVKGLQPAGGVGAGPKAVDLK